LKSREVQLLPRVVGDPCVYAGRGFMKKNDFGGPRVILS
jgi:hypothetical protein